MEEPGAVPKVMRCYSGTSVADGPLPPSLLEEEEEKTMALLQTQYKSVPGSAQALKQIPTRVFQRLHSIHSAVFIQHLLYARHCSGHQGSSVE